jgi:hypothetical protein
MTVFGAVVVASRKETHGMLIILNVASVKPWIMGATRAFLI